MAIPSFQNVGRTTQDVPTENGSTIIVNPGEAVVGTYYDSFLATNPNFQKTADFNNETGSITYRYSEQIGYQVVSDTAPVFDTLGNVGDIYYSGVAGTPIYILVDVTDGVPTWHYGTTAVLEE